MFEGISRYRGPYAGGALAILFYMKQSDLDKQLLQLYLDDIDDAFVEWCNDVVPQFPCAPEFAHIVSEYADMMENALIVFSGYKNEEYSSLAEFMKITELSEFRKLRWLSMPEDEKGAARIIAQRVFEDTPHLKALDSDSTSLSLIMGLYVYMTILCSSCFDAASFRHLFVLSWLIYFSEIMSVPATGCRQ